MKKPRWYANGFVDRAVQHAPSIYWAGWLILLAWTGGTIGYNQLITGHSLLLGLLALAGFMGFAFMIAWTSIF